MAPRVVYDRPIDPEMPVPGAASRRPVVVSATVDPPFVGGGKDVTFGAVVDMPPEELRGVYLSCGWIGSDAPLAFDARSKSWQLRRPSPRRFPILDGDRAFVWAVARNGQISASRAVPIRWLLGNLSPEAVGNNLKSSWPHVRKETLEALQSSRHSKAAELAPHD